MNDEVDRPGDAKVSKTSYNQPNFSNRDPPQNGNITHVFDEVDKPVVGKQITTTEISQVVTTDVEMDVTSSDQMDYVEDHFEIDYDEDNDFIQIDFVDSSVTPDDQISNIEEEEKRNSFTDVGGPDKVPETGQDEKKSKRDSTRTDVDGPGGTPVTPVLSNEDGPFDRMFQTKPATYQKSHESDGIQSMHSVYFPQPSKSKGYKFSINSESFYDMKTFPRGRMVLINVKSFKRSSGMANYPRHGTDRDADMLCRLFLDLGFQVDRYDNPTRAEIKAALKATANADYSRLSCSACAILTHGEKGIIYGSDAPLEINELTSLFQTKGLAGKPKLFFFQACRGSKYMEPHDAVDGPAGQNVAMELPLEADFLYAYSTVEDYYSWRNSSKGSWFVNALVSVFRESAHKLDIMRMLSRVNAEVCMRKSNTDDRSTDNKKQIGSFVTQLRKELFFFPPSGPLKS